MKNLAAALVRAKREFNPVVKDATNPHFKSKFASLQSCHDATDAALMAHGLAVLQFPTEHLGVPALRTVLLHESGEMIEDTMLLNATKPDPQGQGSAITYARRYALMALLGIAAEDDDGNAASDRKETPRQKQTPTATAASGSPPAGTGGKGEPSSKEADGSPFTIPEGAVPKQRPVDGPDTTLTDAQKQQIEGLMDQVAAASGAKTEAVVAKAEKDYGPIPLMSEGAANQLIARFQKFLAAAEAAA